MNLFDPLFASCPPESAIEAGAFLVRHAPGGGRRASCATLLPGAEPGAADPAPALAAFRDLGARPVFMIRPGEAALDARLAAAGLVEEGRSILCAAPSAAIARRQADVTVIDCESPVAVIADLWEEAGIGPARRAVMARTAPPRRYLLGRLDDRPAAAAFVSVAHGVAVLNALHVAPRFRRRGLARRLVEGAAAWAADAGAATFALAVEAENAPARALYAATGLAEAGAYHYRTGEPPH